MTGTPLLPAGLLAGTLLGGTDRPAVEHRPAPYGEPDVAGDALAGSFDLPDLGPCRHQPVLLILLFDNSPSVTTVHDAPGQRFDEAAIALDHYRRRCSCGQELVAVRTFDRRTSSDVGPFTLDGRGWPLVTAALRAPAEIESGWSRLRPALRDAEWLAQRYSQHRTALVVFSDFKLFDWFPSLVLDRLCDFPGRVHAIVLDAEPPARLGYGPVAVSRITAGSPPGTVARTVVAALADASDTGPAADEGLLR
jgi:hypothetical protein